MTILKTERSLARKDPKAERPFSPLLCNVAFSQTVSTRLSSWPKLSAVRPVKNFGQPHFFDHES
jgi:hypothetical protein